MNIFFWGDLTIPAIIVAAAVMALVWYFALRKKRRISVDELEDFTDRWKGEK